MAIYQLNSTAHSAYSPVAGSSKTAPRILIFSIAMGAVYSIDLYFIETDVPQFIGHNKIFLGSVGYLDTIWL